MLRNARLLIDVSPKKESRQRGSSAILPNHPLRIVDAQKNQERKTHDEDDRNGHSSPRRLSDTVSVDADICVLGAGISGTAAAIEAARLGRRVVLADAATSLGGQAVGSIIGTIIGLYSHGKNAYQITHGLADELIAELTASGALLRRHSTRTGTITFQYDVVQLGRWIEQKVHDARVQTLIGATLTDVDFANRRLRSLKFATRFGPGRR